MSGLLINLVADVEVTVRQVMVAATELHGDALINDDDVIHINEIDRTETGTDLRRRISRRKIETAISGTPDDWLQFFKTHFGLDPGTVAGTSDIREPIQRRHCHVHNRGLVSERYIEKVGESSLDAGKPLRIDRDYLEETADALVVFVYSLCWALSFKFLKGPESEKALRWLSMFSFKLLIDCRYTALMRLNNLMPLERIDPESRLTIQTNIWLAFKLSGNFEDIRTDVVAFDVSTLGIKFQLVKSALLGETDKAAQLLEVGLAIGELTESHAARWPLLKDVYPVFLSNRDTKHGE